MRKCTLICGVSGQDGAYLADLLISYGEDVAGTTRGINTNSLWRLEYLNIAESVEMHIMDPVIRDDVERVIRSLRPSKVYYLSGQSSVGYSLSHPYETMQSIAIGIANLLDVCREISPETKVYNASSSECFGNLAPGEKAGVNSRFNPISPYGYSKCMAHWLVRWHRDYIGMNCCNGILFNHESHLRSDKYVTRKIIRGACLIKTGRESRLRLGNLRVWRDWGWAPDFVRAMKLVMDRDVLADYVIATGTSHSLEELGKYVFKVLDLEWEEYVVIDKNLKRQDDILYNCGDSELAKSELSWKPSVNLNEMLEIMIEEELSGLEIERRAYGR